MDEFKNYLQRTKYVKHIDLSKTTSEGCSILMEIFKNHKKYGLNYTSEDFDYLIKNSNLRIVDKKKYANALIYALLCNTKEELNLNQEQFMFLFENSNINVSDFQKATPIMYLLMINKRNNINLTKKNIDLIMSQADYSKTTTNDESILYLALQYNESQKLGFSLKNFIEMAKNVPAYPDEQTIYFQGKFLNLCFKQDISKESMKDLRKLGKLLKIDKKNENNKKVQPIWLEILLKIDKKSNEKISDYFIKNTRKLKIFDINNTNAFGDTALHDLCRRSEYPDNIKKEKIESLLKQGADLNMQDNEGNTPIMLAATQSSVITIFLYEKNVDLHIKNKKGQFVLDVAIENGLTDFISYCQHEKLNEKIKNADTNQKRKIL